MSSSWPRVLFLKRRGAKDGGRADGGWEPTETCREDKKGTGAFPTAARFARRPKQKHPGKSIGAGQPEL
ncbi:MAG TPA: hypothetical protein VFB21_19235 [Chthonomonadaceae bacterium]|nr:hypothetical protein [Chthonomonadaceae bacterium]